MIIVDEQGIEDAFDQLEKEGYFDRVNMKSLKEDVEEEIRNIKEHYKNLEELFAKKRIPACKIIMDTIENLKESPDLTIKYPWLGEYGDKTIYVFLVENFLSDKEEGKKFDEIKKELKKISQESSNGEKILLCRRNKKSQTWENVQKNNYVYLYVGSSKDIHQRLKEHLFLYKPKTYAMHLEKWFDKNKTINITMWDFSDFLDGENSDYLQTIEDLLWNHYQPLFGRQGKK